MSQMDSERLCAERTGVGYGSQPSLYGQERVQTVPKQRETQNGEMPRKKGQSIRDTLERHFGHTMYYLYRNGERPITPDMQEYIKKVCIRNGWNEEPVYDGFTEEYEW